MIKRYNEKLKLSVSEILRYLGYGNNCAAESVLELISEKINQLKTDCRVCYLPLSVVKNSGEAVEFDCFSVESRALSRYIGNAKELVLFCATIGMEFDRLLKREAVISTAGSAVLQAVGACAIESLCDMFCAEFKAKARFSPGYGDLCVSVQKDIFKVLNPEKNIGVTLTDSLIMTPTKSVTAFFVPGCTDHMGCEKCDKKDCAFRKV